MKDYSGLDYDNRIIEPATGKEPLRRNKPSTSTFEGKEAVIKPAEPADEDVTLHVLLEEYLINQFD